MLWFFFHLHKLLAYLRLLLDIPSFCVYVPFPAVRLFFPDFQTLSTLFNFPFSQCWGSEQFYSDSDLDSAPVFQINSDSAPFGSGSESECVRIRIRIWLKITNTIFLFNFLYINIYNFNSYFTHGHGQSLMLLTHCEFLFFIYWSINFRVGILKKEGLFCDLPHRKCLTVNRWHLNSV